MKHLLLATTALAAVSVSLPALADVSIDGYSRFTIDSGSDADEYSPDLNVWVRAEETTDNNLTYGGAARFTPEDASRHYLYLENDAGKLTLGRHHGPAYTMSLGSDWRGTVSAVGKATTPIFQGHTTPRIIYTTPNVSGFQAGVSVSAGSEDLGAETQTGVNYTTHLNDTKIRFAHNRSSVDAVGGSTFGSEATETGIEFTHGKFMASFVTFDKTEATTFTHTRAAYTTQDRTMITNTAKPEDLVHDIETLVSSCDGFEFGGKPGEGGPYLISASKCEDHPDMSFKYGDVLVNERNDFAYANPDMPYVIGSDGHLYHPSEYETVTTVPGEYVPASTSSSYGQETTSGQEIELAYSVNDDMTVNLVNYSDNQDYSRLSLGMKYTFAPNITASIAHSSIDNAGTDEDAMRFRLNYSF